jgi:hypothetical protein
MEHQLAGGEESPVDPAGGGGGWGGFDKCGPKEFHNYEEGENSADGTRWNYQAGAGKLSADEMLEIQQHNGEFGMLKRWGGLGGNLDGPG